VALVLAVGGGVAWAGSKISSGDIKSNAILSRHVDNNALTGEDVKESKLNLNLPVAFDWEAPNTTTSQPVLEVGSLTLEASCLLVPLPDTTLTLTAESTGGGRIEMHYVSRNGTDPAVAGAERGGTADPKQLGAFTKDSADPVSGGGTIVFHPGTEVVTVDLRWIVDDDDTCEVAGTAVRAEP
jgi:hypothetical protein